MKQTPAHDLINPDLMAMIPPETRRIVDVGCMQGSLAKAYRAEHPQAEVIGIDIDPDYAAVASAHCTRALAADVETMDDAAFASLFPSDCWVFGDCLEHLRDPWSVMRRVRARIDAAGSMLICIPNAQHWSVQWRLASGNFRYEDQGLMDRTHIRWFTRQTLLEMFAQTGWQVAQGKTRIIASPAEAQALGAVRAFATASGLDADQAERDARPFQYMFQLRPH
ncbi:MAG: class I SAM-dependent methyltransferase [Lautropia sp.]